MTFNSTIFKKKDFDGNDKLILQKLLSVLPQYTKSDYKIASQNGDSSSTVLPRKSFEHLLTVYLSFIHHLIFFGSVVICRIYVAQCGVKLSRILLIMRDFFFLKVIFVISVKQGPV